MANATVESLRRSIQNGGFPSTPFDSEFSSIDSNFTQTADSRVMCVKKSTSSQLPSQKQEI